MEPRIPTQEVLPEFNQDDLFEQISRSLRPRWPRRFKQSRTGVLLTSFPSRFFFLVLTCYLLLTFFYDAAFSRNNQVAQISNPLTLAVDITIPWRRFDAIYFLHIAQYGYDLPRLPAFFPLYPLLVKLVAWTLGEHFTTAGLVVAWVCCWGSYLWFYRLAEREYGERVAKLGLIALACFPTSFFTFAPYSESVFLLVSFGAIERARAGRPWQAGILAALGMLTRPTGILLLIPLGWELGRRNAYVLSLVNRLKAAFVSAVASLRKAQQALKAPVSSGMQEHALLAPLPWIAWLSLALIPLALISYIAYLQLATGHPLGFLTSESTVWYRHPAMPWTLLPLFVSAYQEAGRLQDPWLYARNTADLILVVPVTLLVIYYAIRRRLIWLGAMGYQVAIVVLLIAVPTFPSHFRYEVLLSTQRFMLPAFPIFLLMGHLGVARPRLYRVLLAASSVILIVYVLHFLGNLFIA